MKSFKQFLMEEPPPADWDRSVFTKSYKKQIDYCVERASKLGSGSSRVVFEIEYEGRPTALKVAKNAAGLAQNNKEADWGLYRMCAAVTTPMIDFDEENDEPRWIHLEKASKLTKSIFKSMTGFSFEDFGNLLMDSEQSRSRRKQFAINYKHGIDEDVMQEIWDSEIFSDVVDLMSNWGIMAGDLNRLANWGVYQGHPVIIDLGFDADVDAAHYSGKRERAAAAREQNRYRW
jgi:hypothetical protein